MAPAAAETWASIWSSLWTVYQLWSPSISATSIGGSSGSTRRLRSGWKW